MTLREAFAKQIERVRNPKWGPQTYMKFTFEPQGALPWVALVDPPGQQALGIDVGSQRFFYPQLLTQFGDDEIEEFNGTPVEGF
jgi:hypothetical protein